VTSESPCQTAGGAVCERPDYAVTPAVRALLRAVCRRDGPYALLLCWPGGVTYLPERYFTPGPFDVVIDRIAGCPLYADVRRLGLFGERRAVIDVARSTPRRRRPPLRMLMADRIQHSA
jgi:hypothetical protein